MNASLAIEEVGHEARLLFVLLDAVHVRGSMPGSMALRWMEAKARVNARLDYSPEGSLFYELLEELEHAGVLADTWIELRWSAAKARIQGTAPRVE